MQGIVKLSHSREVKNRVPAGFFFQLCHDSRIALSQLHGQLKGHVALL